MYLRVFIFLIIGLTATSCAPKISFKIQRPPLQQVVQIKYIEIGKFEIVSGQIEMPKSEKSQLSKYANTREQTLKPAISGFKSKKVESDQITELLRAALVHDLSLHSPYQLINTTGDKDGYSGVVPNVDEVAVISGKIKFFEMNIESGEDLSYFANIHNKGVRLEQSLLASAVAMGMESSGSGFVIPTPYIERLAAIEVEIFMIRKSNKENVFSPQTFRSYYTRKWGGSPKTSHLPGIVRKTILEDFQQDEDSSLSLLSSIDRAGLSFTNPTEYFARGFNLKQNKDVPQTSLDLKIRLGRDIAKQFVKQISPYHETADLMVQDGNSVAATLIRGNAYQQAIAFLQNFDKRTAEDEYNLGLAFEASGEIPMARKHYVLALDRENDNQEFKNAVRRTQY